MSTVTRLPETDRSVVVYQRNVERTFALMKDVARADQAYLRAVPLEEDAGFLLPVTMAHLEDQELIEKLTDWRNAHRGAFPTQFEATPESTRAWMRDRVLGTEDRLLFLVCQRSGRVVGHLGFANALNDERELEVDNVVRGIPSVQPGIMSLAMRAMIRWAEKTLWPERIFLRVFADNEHAVDFYHNLNFETTARISLRCSQEGGITRYTPQEPYDLTAPDRIFLRLEYRPEPCHAVEPILTAGPSVSAREVIYTADAAAHGWNRQWNGYLSRFEEAFAEYVGVKHAIATSSCTGALHLSLLALGIGPGDEVIVPEITWVATANAVAYTGATPIFADVRESDGCLDPESVARFITPRSKAILPVHLYGLPADVPALRRYGLPIVEDAAPSIGAEFQGQRTGSLGNVGCFSFQGAKLAVTGEGGMIVTNDDALASKIRKIWDQGRVPGTFWIDETGWKYKMSNLQAAFGLAQLERVDAMIEAKRRIFGWYDEDLAGLPHVSLLREPEGSRGIYWMTTVRVLPGAPVDRDELCARLKARGIDTRPVFPAISQYPIWGRTVTPGSVAQAIGSQGVNLPSGVLLSRDQVRRVTDAIREILGT